MKLFVGLLLGILLCGQAQAQSVNLNCATGAGGTQWQPASAANPCPVTGTFTISGPITLNTSPSIANGNCIVSAPSSESSAAASTIATSALAANLVVKAGAGNLYGLEVAADSTLSGAAWWIMVYNATSAPGDGAVTPAKCYAMPSGTTSYTGAWPFPIPLSTGIVIGVSTTGCFTKTASIHAFISGDFK